MPAVPPKRPFDPVWVTPLLFLVVGLGFAVTPVVNTFRYTPAADRNKDYSLWFVTGGQARAGEDLYRIGPCGEVRYMYPPTLAVLAYGPLVPLGWTGFVVALTAANVLAWVGCVYLCTLLVAGRWAGLPRVLYWLPSVAVIPYVWDTFLLGQVNLILLGMLLAAVAAVRHGRDWLAGGLLGAAVAAKVFPLPAVVYFAARRRWRAVAGTVLACAVVAGVLPGVTRGFARNAAELEEWCRFMLADQSGATMAARSATGFSRRNQSLVSVAHRLLRPVDAGDRAGVPFRVNVADVPPQTAQLVGYAGCFVLGAVLLWATRLRFAGTPEREGLEVGMVCTLVPLCSPLAWTYFFCWLLPGWTAAIHFAASDRHPRAVRRAGLAAAVLSGLVLAAALSELSDPLIQGYGATAWGAVLLFLTLAGMRWYEGRAVTAGGTAGPLVARTPAGAALRRFHPVG
jgi:hypothetical protein